MTTFIAQDGSRSAFGRSVASVGALVLDAIEATRAIQSAHSTTDRRAVLDRFAADTTRDAA